ncbi:MAG TPA: hypothetical protein VF329_02065 [Gammaproteobacteria bacterium]
MWEDWDDESRTEALRSINLQSGELPVVLAKSPLGAPIVLTTRRLFCLPDVAAVRDIVSVKPREFTKKSKDQLNELNVELESGKTLRISAASGPSYFALWNVLLHISKGNARRRLAS